MPDWRGNNRIDSLRNIVRDNRVSLMFMVPGCNNVVRVNGLAQLTADPDVLNTFEKLKKHPRTVVVVNVKEVYFQCAKALMRSRLWQSEDESGLVPTAGQFIRGFNADIDVDEYDASYGEYAKTKMW
jgi:PPOX class probable FMN-dependent enzyme